MKMEVKRLELRRVPLEPVNVVNKSKRQCPRSFELFSELRAEDVSRLNGLAEEYSNSLDCNDSRNILEEITQLLHLFTLNRPLVEGEECGRHVAAKLGGGKGKLGTTTGEQVYFVLKVLSLQLNTSLSSIDPEIVRFIVNKYPHKVPKVYRKLFSTWVEEQGLKKKNEGRKEGEAHNGLDKKKEETNKPSEFHQCVTFRSEVDGRSNFPTQWDFHAFCKQRDLFYTIKRTWEESQGKEEMGGGGEGGGTFGGTERSSSSNNGFGGGGRHSASTSATFNHNRNRGTVVEVDPLHSKIKALLDMNSNWANLSHLASLFIAQYIMDSMEGKKGREEENDELLKSLKISDPDKFAKLNNRLLSNKDEGKEKAGFLFHRQFISAASSPLFNQHLIDRIAYEIRETEDSLDSEELKEREEVLFKKILLLAKLLGHLSFLPYKDSVLNVQDRSINKSLDKETLWSKQAELRKHQKPVLDLISILTKSLRRGRLTFTMPWVLEFLSAADPVTMRLPAYKEIVAVICLVYRKVLVMTDKNSILTAVNKNFLRFWCGNFFSSDNFPLSLLFPSGEEDDKIIAARLRSLTIQGRTSPTDHKAIDSDSSLGESFLKTYFTMSFKQMQSILTSGLQDQGFGYAGEVDAPPPRRHIKPIPAKPLKGNFAEMELQRQLEFSFFDSNSPSVKKSVDFISERIASNYVKILRREMSARRTALLKEGLVGEQAAEICRQQMLAGVQSFIIGKCEMSVNLLIGESLSSEALKICTSLAQRQASDKIREWIHKHIKEDLFPQGVLPLQDNSEQINKVSSNSDIEEMKEEGIGLHTIHSIMIILHQMMKDLHDEKTITEEELDAVLNCHQLATVSGFSSTLIDFGIALIAYSPSLLTLERQSKLLALWKPSWSSDYSILNPRNILILSRSPESSQTHSKWEVFESILLLLIKDKLLDFETVEQDCFWLLREDLSPEESNHVSQLLRRLLSETQPGTQDDYDARMSREVVDWISWLCSDAPEGEF